jgi:type IV secretion system protein TrbL
MDTGVIDRFTEVFTRYIDSGFGLLGGDVAFLASTLIAIDVTLAGLFWAWGADEDVLAHLVKKTLYVGFFAFLIGNFNSLAKIVFNSFSGLGLKAAGSSLSADQFLQPGRLAQVGIDAGKPILDAASQLMGYVSFFANFIQIFVLLTAWLVVVVAFFILAIQLFVTLIEFKLTTLAGFILVPFGLFSKTAFLAERVLGNVVASGVKVLVLAVIVGIGTTLFSEFTQGFNGNQPSLEDALALVLAALSLLGLGIFGPGIATGLTAGPLSLERVRPSGPHSPPEVLVSPEPSQRGPARVHSSARPAVSHGSQPEKPSPRPLEKHRLAAPAGRRPGRASCVANRP